VRESFWSGSKWGKIVSNYMTQLICSVMCFTKLCAHSNGLNVCAQLLKEINGLVFCVIVAVEGKLKIYNISRSQCPSRVCKYLIDINTERLKM